MEQIVETFVLVPMLDLDALVPQTVDQLVGVLQILDMSSRVEQAIEVPTIRTGSRGAPWKYLLSCLTQCFQLHSFRGLQEVLPAFRGAEHQGLQGFLTGQGSTAFCGADLFGDGRGRGLGGVPVTIFPESLSPMACRTPAQGGLQMLGGVVARATVPGADRGPGRGGDDQCWGCGFVFNCGGFCDEGDTDLPDQCAQEDVSSRNLRSPLTRQALASPQLSTRSPVVPVWVTEMTWSDSWGIKESRMSGQRGSVKECLKLREKAVRTAGGA